jgi:hypothetical protein
VAEVGQAGRVHIDFPLKHEDVRSSSHALNSCALPGTRGLGANLGSRGTRLLNPLYPPQPSPPPQPHEHNARQKPTRFNGLASECSPWAKDLVTPTRSPSHPRIHFQMHPHRLNVALKSLNDPDSEYPDEILAALLPSFPRTTLALFSLSLLGRKLGRPTHSLRNLIPNFFHAAAR